MKKNAVISIVGRPNVGKSTLTNALVSAKVAIVSNKPQTTRTRITGVITKDDTQFVFMDTPGLHKPRSRLGDYMVKIIRETVCEVDLVALVIEPYADIGPAEEELISRIKQSGVPAILIINKIDMVEKDKLLEVIAFYSQKHEFKAIIPVCARTDDGLDVLFSEFSKYSQEGEWLFDEEAFSDQPEKVLISEIIREKMLHSLDKEIPHGVAVYIEKLSERPNGIIDIHAVIYCEKKSHKGIIIGKQGSMLKKIGSTARYEIEKLFDTKANLQLWIKIKEDWRNNPAQIRNFGYEE